ncbi:quinohemoprotein amine dehydrogenase subunit alpha [Azoarcus sp. DN11]|uniref:quinohemoprotein amine dehydrogenase subunit alpha n=1 Tax=Azoarcus sp. DN11 TaxID=356837 RepID=UPI000EAEFEB2|nr:quinohemoprotein amine dehydrogenase subunit alpha [Azoarcus sp. DN11]AYH44879.1 quinohemoprotein amine dehydrogenase subunit alpha [Azoarcus sp. DN11]
MKAETRKITRRTLRSVGALALAIGLGGAAVAAQDPGRDVIDKKCVSCHLEGGKLTRIPEIRKSPEGWDMTVTRMGIWHKVELTTEERRAVVKYLADRQGLAPAESAAFRSLMERRPNTQDTPPDEEFAQMCGRCHSFGRVALQRRDEDEWRKLMHTHLGQFPSAEYSALGRDRNWWEIARDKMPGRLAGLYPKNTDAWRDWSRAKHRPADGRWVVAGERPGWGPYTGTMTAVPKGKDKYEVNYELHFGPGNTVRGHGDAVIYTGYEWRGSTRLGNEDTRAVFALSEDGSRISGRWFLKNAEEIGATFEALRSDKAAKNAVVSVSPKMLRAGETATVTVAGAGLDPKVDLGPGVEVVEWLGKSADVLKLRVKVATDAPQGVRKVAVGGRESGQTLAVYRQIDSVRVEPAFAIARLGGGTNPPASAQFDAVAYLNGPDGKAGTDDDVRLGSVPATWSAEPFDERAKHDEDLKFAGHMEPHGQFLPAFAGPNPNRRGLNNVGNLAVVATVADGERALDAKGHLMVTVQRWNPTPLR